MKFPKVFTRTEATIGKDSLPADGPKASHDNVIQLRHANVNGFPVQRLVVGYDGPEREVEVAAYVFDEGSQKWFNTEPVHDAHAICGRLTYIDVPTVGNLSREDSGGAIEVMFLVSMPAGEEPAKGVYTFAIGADVSNPA